MKICILITLHTFLSFFSIYGATTYQIENLEGYKIEIKDPHYDGNELKFTRVSDGRTFRITPEKLKTDSWEKLNYEFTASMRPTLQVIPRSHSKKEETHWKTTWGSHESSYQVIRGFQIKAKLTNHFTKPVTLKIFFIDGDDQITVQTIKHDLNYNNPINLDNQVEAKQEVLHLNALGITFSDGREVKGTDFVVTLHHENGTIADTYATNKSALDVVLKALKSQKESTH